MLKAHNLLIKRLRAFHTHYLNFISRLGITFFVKDKKTITTVTTKLFKFPQIRGKIKEHVKCICLLYPENSTLLSNLMSPRVPNQRELKEIICHFHNLPGNLISQVHKFIKYPSVHVTLEDNIINLLPVFNSLQFSPASHSFSCLHQQSPLKCPLLLNDPKVKATCLLKQQSIFVSYSYFN